MRTLAVCYCYALRKSSYIFIMFLENLLIFNVAVHLKQIANHTANYRQLLGDRLKTRQTSYRPVWPAKGFRCTCKNLQPTKIYNNQWQPFRDFKKPFYNLWQPTAEQTFWEVVERSATGFFLLCDCSFTKQYTKSKFPLKQVFVISKPGTLTN